MIEMIFELCIAEVWVLCLKRVVSEYEFGTKIKIKFVPETGFCNVTKSTSWNIDIHTYAKVKTFISNYTNPESLITFPDAQKPFTCPNDKRGQYQDPVQCDKYYECLDGEVFERLCPDGLVFDETIRLKNKCDQPFNVDCGERTLLRKFILSVIYHDGWNACNKNLLHGLKNHSICLTSPHHS